MSGKDIPSRMGAHPTQDAIAKKLADATREELPERVREATEVRGGVFDSGRWIKVGVFDAAAPKAAPLAATGVDPRDAEDDIENLAQDLAARATQEWERRRAAVARSHAD